MGARGPVLVIDDHPVNRMLLEQVLELESLEVVGVGSIAEAERVLERTAPAAVVLDMQLPDGHGLELARRLRADPATAACPIVACTAGRAPGEAAQALALGVTHYVTKPINTERFGALVAELLDG